MQRPSFFNKKTKESMNRIRPDGLELDNMSNMEEQLHKEAVEQRKKSFLVRQSQIPIFSMTFDLSEYVRLLTNSRITRCTVIKAPCQEQKSEDEEREIKGNRM